MGEKARNDDSDSDSSSSSSDSSYASAAEGVFIEEELWNKQPKKLGKAVEKTWTGAEADRGEDKQWMCEWKSQVGEDKWEVEEEEYYEGEPEMEVLPEPEAEVPVEAE